jgi:hypothetical protein
MMPGAGGDVNTTTPLILNIVAAFFCSGSCLGSIVAIVGILFAIQAGNAKGAGDLATAQAKAKSSMLMAYIALGLGFVLYILISILRAMSG